MTLDIIKASNPYKNYWGMILALVGMLIYLYSIHLKLNIGIELPPIVTVTIYFMALSLIFKMSGQFAFICITFFFVIVYFTVVSANTLSVEGIYTALVTNTYLPLNIYALVLLPASFLGSYLDFFELAKQVPNNRLIWFKYLLQVLVKKELVVKRYKQVMEAFYAKGYNTKSALVRYSLISKWIIPVVVTTIMEGVESHDYNLMLNHYVEKSSSYSSEYRLNNWKRLLFYFFVLLVIIGLFYEYLFG